MARETTQEVLQRLLRDGRVLSTRDVAEAAGVSRQMAQKLLKERVSRGELTISGRARAARYHPVPVDDPRLERRGARSSHPGTWLAAALGRAPGEVDDSPKRRVDDVERSLAAPGVDDSRPTDFRQGAQVWDTGSPYAVLD
jgi:hypothetical protein